MKQRKWCQLYLLGLFFFLLVPKAWSDSSILKPESIEKLAEKLHYKNATVLAENYQLFHERVTAGFLPPEWMDQCEKERRGSLCSILKEYFAYLKVHPEFPPKPHFKHVGKINKKKLESYQKENFQALVRALPTKKTSLLLSYAKAAEKHSGCPLNLDLALAYDLDYLSGQKKYFRLIETLYKKGLECSEPKDAWYELTHMRMALIYTALGQDKEAIPFFKKALEATDTREDYRSLYYLAKLNRKKDSAEAERYFNILLDKYPRSWYTIKLLIEKRLDPLQMNLRASLLQDVYSSKNEAIDEKFTWLKVGLLLDKDPYNLKKYAEYLADFISANTEMGFIQHIERLLHAADLYKPQINFLNRYLTLANPPITRELLEYLYPAPFLQIFNAQGAELDTAILIGLARQESSFDVRAKSSADARGLLQLMPSTARHLGTKKSQRLWSPTDNIRTASKYLIRLAKRFDNSIERAMAAYNAGPLRVEEWQKQYSWVKDPEVFVDLIPFRETRDYVPTILRNAYWYHRLYPGAINVSKKEYVTSGLLKPLLNKFVTKP